MRGEKRRKPKKERAQRKQRTQSKRGQAVGLPEACGRRTPGHTTGGELMALSLATAPK